MKNKGLPVVLLGLLAAVQAVAQQGPVVLDRIVAKVDNRYILRSDIEQSFYQYQEEAKARKTTAPTRCQILNSLIINKVMLAKAEIDSVVVDDRRIESELQGRMDQMLQMYGSEKSLVEQFGKSVEQLKAELRPDIQDQLLVDEMRSKITNNVSVTPGEVRKFFNSIPKDSLPYFPSEVEIGQIVRLATVTREEMTALKTRLLDYKKRSLPVKTSENWPKPTQKTPAVPRTAGCMPTTNAAQWCLNLRERCFGLSPVKSLTRLKPILGCTSSNLKTYRVRFTPYGISCCGPTTPAST